MIDIYGVRGSGRTTRMVFAAIQQAYITGERVWIVSHDSAGVAYIKSIISKIIGENPHIRVTLTTINSSGVVVNSQGVVVLGVKPDLVYVDHWVYTTLLQNIHPLLKGLVKYD